MELIPITGLAIAAIKASFKNEINYWSEAIAAYFHRPYDDGDPNTPDRCQIFNEGNGNWDEVIIIDYRIGLNKNRNGVYIQYVNDGYARERVSFSRWGELRKRRCPQ